MILLQAAFHASLDLSNINVYIHINEKTAYQKGSGGVRGLRLF